MICDQQNLPRESALHQKFLDIQRERLKEIIPRSSKPQQSKKPIEKINRDYRNQVHDENNTFRFNRK
jgi:hypothetical protein